MKISSELLYHFLEEKHAVTRYGRGFHKEELPLPLFFERGSNPEEGRVYIVRSSDLPQTCHTECLFLCVGSRPIQSFGYWAGEVFYIDERSLDVFSLSNMVFGFFDKISGWHSAMQKLLDEHAPVEEFVRASIPIFQNAITISDYDLRLLVNCSDIEENGQRKIVISQEFSRIPDAISLRFADMYKKQICMQEPFFFKGQMEDPDGENYCINLFLGGSVYRRVLHSQPDQAAAAKRSSSLSAVCRIHPPGAFCADARSFRHRDHHESDFLGSAAKLSREQRGFSPGYDAAE